MSTQSKNQQNDFYKIGMVFGVFDGLHEGHKYFLSEASRRSETLIVVVTLPEIVQLLKKKLPKHSFEKRSTEIISFNDTFKVVPSDKTLGEWQVLRDYKPDMIFLGHDQQGIAEELKKIGIVFTFIEAHFPDRFKSSLLN